MEAGEIAFRRDGAGWTYWSRDGGGFSVRRFSWHADEGRLVLAVREMLQGVCDLGTIANRFAFQRELVEGEEDPAADAPTSGRGGRPRRTGGGWGS